MTKDEAVVSLSEAILAAATYGSVYCGESESFAKKISDAVSVFYDAVVDEVGGPKREKGK